jgi:2-hydroxy-3-oxopropionate reductase
MRIGFVGLGVMGRPMALNLIRHGFDLVVHTRTPDRAEPLLREGAQWASSAAEVAAATNLTLTILPDSADVLSVATGATGLLDSMPPQSIWIDMSTISPVITQRLAQEARARDIAFLDAPVSGGEQGAIDGTLVIMVGGKEQTLLSCTSILECLGSSIVHVGDHGAGQVAKACNQVIVGVTIAAVAEALALGARAHVDPSKLREALLGGFAKSRVLEVHGQRMIDATFEPGFRLSLHQKDLAIVLDTAREYSAFAPLTALVGQIMNHLIAHGDGGLDLSALIRAY